MVVTTKEYLEHYDHDNVQQFLGELFEKKTVVFLGYGLEELEMLEHILRRGQVKQTGDRRRFAVQGFFVANSHCMKGYTTTTKNPLVFICLDSFGTMKTTWAWRTH